jgi:hypothetical protein
MVRNYFLNLASVGAAFDDFQNYRRTSCFNIALKGRANFLSPGNYFNVARCQGGK